MSFPGAFVNMPDLNMQSVRRAPEVKYVRRKCEMLCSSIISESDMVDLSHYCFLRPSISFYQIREVDIWGQELDLKVGQRSKGLLVSWHNI